MALVETECLVVKTYNLAEADKIAVLLTRDHGVIRGVAKGAKRLKSRFGSSMEPFSVLRVEYFEKETSELVSIQKVDLVASNFFAASDPRFLQKFSYLAELLILFSPPNDPNEVLYRMVRASVDTAARSPDTLEAIGVYFESWLLRLAGFLPDWSRCELCGSPIEGDDGLAGVLPDLHLHCSVCRKPVPERTISDTARRIMEDMRSKSPSDFAAAYKHNRSELAELTRLLRQLVTRSLGKEGPGEVSLALDA
jgi:DNA repair protein RecO (recombination protein O)